MEEQPEYKLCRQLKHFSDEIVLNVVHVYFEREVLNKTSLPMFLDLHKHAIFHEYHPNSTCCKCEKASSVPSEKSRSEKSSLPSEKSRSEKREFMELYDKSGTVPHCHDKRHKQYCLCKFQPKDIKVAKLDINQVCVIIKSTSVHHTPPVNLIWLQSLKEVRNSLAHLGSPENLSKQMFDEKWSTLEKYSLKIASTTCQSHAEGIRDRIKKLKEENGITNRIQTEIKVANANFIKDILTAFNNSRASCSDDRQLPITFGKEKLVYTITDMTSQLAETSSVNKDHEQGILDDQPPICVHWKLSNPTMLRVEDIKKKLKNVKELEGFKIEFIYDGSVQIESSVAYAIAHNPDVFAACVLQFLERFAAVCKIDTSKDSSIDVEIVFSDIPRSKMTETMACDDISTTVLAYLNHIEKRWKHCAPVSMETVKTVSTKTDPITISKKRKSKSKVVPVSKRKRSDISLSESVKDEDENLPSTSGSLHYEEERKQWSMENIAWNLKKHSLEEVAKIFEDENIYGEVLKDLDIKFLKDIGIRKLGDRLKTMNVIQNIIRPPEEYQRKIFNDPVNGHTEIHPLCIRIIDTPQFQRLRDLKQAGTCYYVYPGATNNRFEHSIGVCYLAGQLAQTLQKRQPELNITNVDILCVEIAGLCHDLGHGPFSHLFDGKFIPAARPGLTWKHEDASVTMFNYLVEENKLGKEFEKYGLLTQDIKFITEQIAGPVVNKKKGWPYNGRNQEKGFLYEIVANKRNGIDVDKWDYCARDCHGLGIKNTFDHNRFMKFARVLKVNGGYQICYRDKEAETLYSMFQIRATLHRRAYQHRVCNAVEAMITDAFLAADKKGIVPGKDGKMIKLSECIDDPTAYTNLTDSIFHVILMSTDEDLDESKKILQRVQHRQLYACVGETTPTDEEINDPSQIISSIMDKIPIKSRGVLEENDLYIDLVNLDYGRKSKNPLNNVSFYNKNDVNSAVKIQKHQVSLMLPTVFSEQMVRLFCKRNDKESLQIASNSFALWCKANGFTLQDKISKGLKTDE